MQVGANTAICCKMKTWVEVELAAEKNLPLNSHYAKIVKWVCVLHTKFPNGTHHSFNMLLLGIIPDALPDIAFVQPGCSDILYTVALCI